MKFLWIITLVACCFAAQLVLGSFVEKGAPQQAASAAMAVALAVVPYCLTRSVEGIKACERATAQDAAKVAARPATSKVVTVVLVVIGMAWAGLTVATTFFHGSPGNSEGAQSVVCRDPNEYKSSSGTCLCKEGYHLDPTTLKCIPKSE